MVYEHREDTVGGGGSRQCQIHTHTQSVLRDTQDGWSHGQGSDAMLTDVSVAPPLIKLVCCEHREDTVGGAGSRQWQTHTHTQFPP